LTSNFWGIYEGDFPEVPNSKAPRGKLPFGALFFEKNRKGVAWGGKAEWLAFAGSHMGDVKLGEIQLMGPIFGAA
jgi:hypothetical protein